MNETTNTRKTILSGIQPTGKVHVGNLIGAINNWVKFQDMYDCYYTVVDLHSITVRQNAADLRKNSLNMAALLIACGIDPEKAVLFIQSQVTEHAQLAWVLNCFTGMGELGRMTQFKDKSQKNADNINVGLFSYPVLQAADILLYQADMVPVGEDQKQHLELTRNIAERFNFHYSPTFTVPEPFIPPVGAKIMNLQEPTKKMSKSDDNEKATLYLTDSDNEIMNKIKRSVTDSGSGIKIDDKKPGITNLMTLYNVATSKPFDEIEAQFSDTGYGDFKIEVADAMVKFIRPLREKFVEVSKDKDYLKKVLAQGAERASWKASKTLRKVYKKVGFVQF